MSLNFFPELFHPTGVSVAEHEDFLEVDAG